MSEEQRMLTEQEIDQALQERHTKERHQKIKAARVAVAGLGGLAPTLRCCLPEPEWGLCIWWILTGWISAT